MRTITFLLLSFFAFHVNGQDIIARQASVDKRLNKIDKIDSALEKKQNNTATQKGLSKQKTTAKNKAGAKEQQKSLVTRGMATKIAVVLLKSNVGGLEHVIFQTWNDITDLQTEAKILHDVYNHLDYIERFIVGIYNFYGVVDAGTVMHKYFVLNWEENLAAEKIYENWKETENDKARQKEIKKQQENLKREHEQYEEWTSTGIIPVMSESKVSKKAVLTAKTMGLWKE